MSEQIIKQLINDDIQSLISFLANPLNLRLWTVHRDLYWHQGQCSEATFSENEVCITRIEVGIVENQTAGSANILFKWSRHAECIKQFKFDVEAKEPNKTEIKINLGHIADCQRVEQIKHLLTVEFTLLEAELNGVKADLQLEEISFLQHYHRSL